MCFLFRFCYIFPCCMAGACLRALPRWEQMASRLPSVRRLKALPASRVKWKHRCRVKTAGTAALLLGVCNWNMCSRVRAKLCPCLTLVFCIFKKKKTFFGLKSCCCCSRSRLPFVCPLCHFRNWKDSWVNNKGSSDEASFTLVCVFYYGLTPRTFFSPSGAQLAWQVWQ